MEKNETRLLGAQEILFYVMNEASAKHFLVTAEVEGYTTRDGWKAAVTALQEAHPMLRMSIVIKDDNLVFSESETPLLLEIAGLTESLDLNQAIEMELEKGFRSDNGPLARIKLFYSEQKSVVIIATHHSVSDALSSVNLLNDLVGLLQGKPIHNFPVQPSVDTWLGFDNDKLGAKVNEQIKPGRALPHEFVKHHPGAKVDIIHFSKELTDKLAYWARKQSTTVHGALQAAAALSLEELAFDVKRPAYIMSPFSIRKQMNIGTDCGLFIDTKIVAVATDQDLDFWDIARSAKDGLSDVHSREFLESSAGQLRGLISSSDDLIQFIKDNFNFDIMLSNLGRLSVDNATASLKINNLMGPFIISGFNNQQAIGATTYDGKLTLTNSSRFLVHGLLTMMKTRIEAACDQSVYENAEPVLNTAD